jgi:hypothetical protein
MQDDGKIVLGGFLNYGGNDLFALVRYTTSIGDAQGSTVVTQSDGKIILARASNSTGHFVFARCATTAMEA